jgi:hypothetical protein
MKVDVILGLQWGDEGKGKIVDVLTPNYGIVARFQGGPNAGHTLEFEGQKYILKSIPSGIFQEGKLNIIGNGVVIDPALFKQEVEALEKNGHKLTDRLYISNDVPDKSSPFNFAFFTFGFHSDHLFISVRISHTTSNGTSISIRFSIFTGALSFIGIILKSSKHK